MSEAAEIIKQIKKNLPFSKRGKAIIDVRISEDGKDIEFIHSNGEYLSVPTIIIESLPEKKNYSNPRPADSKSNAQGSRKCA